jgi:hypothetical protein
LAAAAPPATDPDQIDGVIRVLSSGELRIWNSSRDCRGAILGDQN